ncbi:MAG TPA: argininosuccinate lyase, partial [Candidatus Baltobacteraceae bacterium]|nr:argininosuccinate lyase [Candidatus Baltobacteraceae bacterium]
IVNAEQANQLTAALEAIAAEIAHGTFAETVRASKAEDIHGAIDARVRELAPDAGEQLHAGRSRNDQVATTLLLYAADRAAKGKRVAARIAAHFAACAKKELDAGTLLAATTHWQPAQPVLLAFWLCAAAEPFARDAQRFAEVQTRALESCPLGSAAVAGSSLPLDRQASAGALGFAAPSRNAMDAIGNRDAALDLAHAFVRVLVDASRICEEFVIWCTPNFGYVRLDDAASTGSSLMPQKRNPDPFELVRATSASMIGRYAGALAAVGGAALSYHRDLQIAKEAIIAIAEQSLSALEAFARALEHVHFNRGRISALAGEGYTAATDVADALILSGMTAREAHSTVGASVRANERDGTPLNWPDAIASVQGKTTSGSTNPDAVRESLEALHRVILSLSKDEGIH